jgi:tripartite-type tricarboxylate transporter receptor subunit TctC
MMALTAAFSAPAIAQDSYPDGPIHLIVGFPPGGGADLLARLLAPRLQETLGAPVIVENKPGAQGRIGVETVASAKPDGQTLIMSTEGAVIILPNLSKLPYDPLKDLAPVSLVVRTAPIIVANKDLKVDSLADLIKQAKANPGKFNYGHSGVGGPNHLTFEMFKQMAGVDIQQIPYKGTGEVIPAVIGGEVELAIGYIPSFIPHIQAGSVKPLAVTLAERSDALPDVPTVAESGVEGFEMSSWLGVLAPGGTPQPIIDKIHDAIAAALQEEDVRKTILAGGQDIIGSTPEEFGRTIATGYKSYGELIKTLGPLN